VEVVVRKGVVRRKAVRVPLIGRRIKVGESQRVEW
jgi:hypothetical protein